MPLRSARASGVDPYQDCNFLRTGYCNPRILKEALAGISTQPLITVDPSLPSFEGHPFFEKKAAKAKILLKKTGLPKQLSKKARS